VIANVGLCISVHQIVEMAEMFIYPNEGAAYIVTVFNMTMFRPFIDEVLVGKVYGCTPEGTPHPPTHHPHTTGALSPPAPRKQVIKAEF
jgi:hypothetical protein